MPAFLFDTARWTAFFLCIFAFSIYLITTGVDLPEIDWIYLVGLFVLFFVGWLTGKNSK